MESLLKDYLELMNDVVTGFEQTISGLPSAGLNWKPGDDTNSIAVLTVHTAGATKFLIGDIVLGEPIPRDRDKEFAAQGLAEADLKKHLSDLSAYLNETVPRMTLEMLAEKRQIRATERTAGWALLHALDHAREHLGHVQLTRQLWEQQNA